MKIRLIPISALIAGFAAASLCFAMAFLPRRRKARVDRFPESPVNPTPPSTLFPRLLPDDASLRKKSKQLGQSCHIVKSYYLRHGAFPPSSIDVIISTLRDMADAGANVNDIAEILCVDKTYVRALARKFTIHISGYKLPSNLTIATSDHLLDHQSGH